MLKICNNQINFENIQWICSLHCVSWCTNTVQYGEVSADGLTLFSMVKCHHVFINSIVPSCNKPLSEPYLKQDIWCHMVSPGRSELKLVHLCPVWSRHMINSLKPDDAYMGNSIRLPLVHIMACHLLVAKPSHEINWDYSHSVLQEQTLKTQRCCQGNFVVTCGTTGYLNGNLCCPQAPQLASWWRCFQRISVKF